MEAWKGGVYWLWRKECGRDGRQATREMERCQEGVVIRISTRGRYALRAMVDLAQHGESGPVARQAIAERQDISPDYVAQLFRDLAQVGMVEGVRGPGGGYRLARPAAAITAREIVEAVEGPITLVSCADSNDGRGCQRFEGCVTRQLWKDLSEKMREVLGSVTLDDLRRKGQ